MATNPSDKMQIEEREIERKRGTGGGAVLPCISTLPAISRNFISVWFDFFAIFLEILQPELFFKSGKFKSWISLSRLVVRFQRRKKECLKDVELQNKLSSVSDCFKIMKNQKYFRSLSIVFTTILIVFEVVSWPRNCLSEFFLMPNLFSHLKQTVVWLQ